MKKYIFTTAIVFSFIIGISSPLEGNFICPSRELKDEIKPELKPDFKYDSSKTTRISITKEEQVKEIEVPLFIGEKYKFIFNTKKLPKDVVIEVYDKKQGKKNRELLYTSSKDTPTGNTYAYEPEKSRTMYINYRVPALEESKSGCVVFLLGYRI